MKCMGDFGSGYVVETGDDTMEPEMGFKFKKPKFKVKIKPPKIIKPILKPIQSVIRPISKPVTSIVGSVVRNPVGAVTTGVAATLAPAAIAASVIPGVNKITAPVTGTILSAAAPVTTAVAPAVLAPVSMVSPGAAQVLANTIYQTPAAQSVVAEGGQEVVESASPAVTLNSDGKAVAPVLDTTPAQLISSASSVKKEEKKGNAGAVIGGLAVAGIAAYFFMKD